MAADSDQLSSLARSAIPTTFTQLWSNGHFSDATLVTEDEQIFRAHKSVL